MFSGRGVELENERDLTIPIPLAEVKWVLTARKRFDHLRSNSY
jgi:hypothetical protein